MLAMLQYIVCKCDLAFWCQRQDLWDLWFADDRVYVDRGIKFKPGVILTQSTIGCWIEGSVVGVGGRKA